jgi:hypothetical protein
MLQLVMPQKEQHSHKQLPAIGQWRAEHQLSAAFILWTCPLGERQTDLLRLRSEVSCDKTEILSETAKLFVPQPFPPYS